MYGVGIKYTDDEFGVLTGVDNIKYKEDILEDFESFRYGESHGRSVEYYPLPQTRVHELKHIEQYKIGLKKFYDIALEKINWIEEPPSDWCKTDKIDEYLKKRQKAYKKFLIQAAESFKTEMKDTYEKRQAEAEEAGKNYLVNVLMKKVSNCPN